MNRSGIHDAATWRLLGLLFERPGRGWLDEVLRLDAEVGDPQLQRAAAAAAKATEGAYLAVFGPGGAVSPREVAYRPMGDPGRILSGLSGFYDAFAYRPRTEEPADHVAVETGFVAYLLLKESYSRSGDDADSARTAADARSCFLDEHLREFSVRLAEQLDGTALEHLVRAGRTLSRLCAEHAPTTTASALRVLQPGSCAT